LGKSENSVLTTLVPRHVWFGVHMEKNEKGSFALMGCTVAPGFEFQDFKLANRKDLMESFPDHKDLILQLTRE
jgi:uncharacterized protein